MNLKEGVPQGSPVSPLLFCLATAKLPKVVKEAAPNFQVDQFADDLAICTTESTVKDPNSQLEPALNAVEKWAEENEMKIAGKKTDSRGLRRSTRTQWESGYKLQVSRGCGYTVKRGRDLGHITIDSQLTLASHAQNMRKQLNRRMSVLTALSGKNWGPSSNDLRSLYKTYDKPGGLYAAEAWAFFLSFELENAGNMQQQQLE